MEKYISREDIPEVIGHLYQFLVDVSEINSLGVYHVIFSMGTIITVDTNENIIPFEYTPEHMETWPVEKLDPAHYSAADIPIIYKDLCSVYAEQLKGLKDYHDIIASAYMKLMQCNSHSSCIIQFGEDVHMVQSPVYANIIDAPLEECSDIAKSMYHFDQMFPQIYAIVTPELEIILWAK